LNYYHHVFAGEVLEGLFLEVHELQLVVVKGVDVLVGDGFRERAGVAHGVQLQLGYQPLL
jgi:hypothetical protein